jgi:uncharacterized metal-binding protein YceD (DUF177 family)
MPRDAPGQARELARELAADLNLDLVALSRGGPGPYRLQATLPVSWIASKLAHTDAEIQRPARVDLEVTVIGEGASVLVRGALDLEFSVPCARCLDPATVPAGTDLCVHFVRGAAHSAGHGTRARADDDESGEELDSTAPDERSFAGTHLDLRPMIEEQILVAYPIRALCPRGEDCCGLCMHCGANLNDQPPAPRCAVCGQPGARVPVVNPPGHVEDEADMEAAAAVENNADAKLHTDAGNATDAAPVGEGFVASPDVGAPAAKPAAAPEPEVDTPWKQALRGLDLTGKPRKKPSA